METTRVKVDTYAAPGDVNASTGKRSPAQVDKNSATSLVRMDINNSPVYTNQSSVDNNYVPVERNHTPVDDESTETIVYPIGCPPLTFC